METFVELNIGSAPLPTLILINRVRRRRFVHWL